MDKLFKWVKVSPENLPDDNEMVTVKGVFDHNPEAIVTWHVNFLKHFHPNYSNLMLLKEASLPLELEELSKEIERLKAELHKVYHDI